MTTTRKLTERVRDALTGRYRQRAGADPATTVTEREDPRIAELADALWAQSHLDAALAAAGALMRRKAAALRAIAAEADDQGLTITTRLDAIATALEDQADACDTARGAAKAGPEPRSIA